MQNEMLMVRLAGGLGNQLFQLAAGKSANPKSLFLENSLLIGTNRSFEINALKRHTGFEVSQWDLQTNLFAKRIYEKKEFEWQQIELSKKRMNVLNGYFQHPKYAEAILRDLAQVAESRLSLTKADKCTCGWPHIAIHIRRGDYLSVPKNKKTFGVLSNQYFATSTSLFPEHTHFIVFSDSEIERELRAVLDPILRFSFDRGKLNPLDLLLKLSSFDGIVMSNSSLSWWSARIGMKTNPGFRVLSPDVWFKKIPESKNLILEEWELLTIDWVQ